MTHPKRHQRLSARGPLLIGFAALALLIGVIGVWSIRTKIAGAIIASGMIQVESNRQVIQHPQGGVVGDILAKDGDRVAAGDVLVRLDDTLLRSELTIVERQLAELRARRARLEAERDGQPDMPHPDDLRDSGPEVTAMLEGQRRLFDARRDTLHQEETQLRERVIQARNQITGTEARLSALTRQGELIEAELSDARALLDRGLTQAARVSTLDRDLAGVLGNIGELDATIARIKGQIAELELQRVNLHTARRETAIEGLRDLQYREIELAQRQVSLLETLSRMDIRSPVSGVVYGSKVFALRAVVSAAEPIMYVIPQDQPLVVAARIDAIHIDQVHIGQTVTLRFTAFDQRTTPEIIGQVARLSADVFTDEATGMSYYSADLLPNDDELEKLGALELLPGMPVEAFIKTQERTPISYLTKPLTDYFNRAFR